MASPEGFPVETFVRRTTSIRNEGYIAIASAVVVYYDHILTIKSELSIIKNAPPSLLKILFFIPRYLAVAMLTLSVYQLATEGGKTHCHISISMLGTFGIIVQFSVSMTIAIKTAAVYAMSRMVKRVIWGLFVLGSLCSVYFGIHTVIKLNAGPSGEDPSSLSKPGHVCVVDRLPNIAVGIPIGHLAFDLTATLLLLSKAYRQYAAFKGYTSSSVVKVLIRYGVLHCILRDGTLLAIAIAWSRMKLIPEAFGPLNLLTALTASIHTRSFIGLRKTLHNDTIIGPESSLALQPRSKTSNTNTSDGRSNPSAGTAFAIVPSEIPREGNVSVISDRDQDFP